MFERYAARVAVIGPLSGPRAAWGRLLTDAIELAATGVRWVFHDDRGDAVEARRRAEEIVLDGGYSAVLGHFNSRGARAALPLYRDAGLPCMVTLATEPRLTSLAGGLALRWCSTDESQARALLGALAGAGYGSVEVVTDGTPHLNGLTDLLLTTGLGRVSVTRLRQGRAPSAPHGAVIVVAVHHKAAAMARDLRARRFRGQLAFTDDCALAEFATLAGDAAAGALVTTQPGGAASRVNMAVTTLASALRADPSLTGRNLVDAVRRNAPVAFEPSGELASRAWTVTRLPEHAIRLEAA